MAQDQGTPETAAQEQTEAAPQAELELTVIVPARNEEDCLAACLESLTAQSEKVFELCVDWELIVVDDDSTDRTREIAESFSGVTVISPHTLEKGWTGKNNACWTAAQQARGRWLLFTDADTIHEPGDLHRALHEAHKNKVGLLSYSPRQLVSGLWQRALMPLVFCELALAFPTQKVSDPESRIAAANGQFLLISHEAYEAIGGHEIVKGEILEDVKLASRAKKRKLGVRFRYAADALSTRMYRTTEAMIEGWTKNLAQLFGNCPALAAWRVLDILLLVGLPLLAASYWSYALPQVPWFTVGWVLVLVWLRNLWRYYARVAKSKFGALDCLLSPLALPLFVVILVRSWYLNDVLHRVSWKGRSYDA
jgi:glycosyltransferase involved in cell wall biosynthesis